MRILAPSIVDPNTHRGGIGAVGRGLASLLSSDPLGAHVEFLGARTDRRLHRTRQAVSLARCAVHHLPSKALFTRSARFSRHVAERLREERFDLLLLIGSDLLWLLEELPERPPAVLLSANLEASVYRSQIDNAPLARRFLGGLLRRDWKKLRDYESAGMREVGNVIFLSAADAVECERTLPGLHAIHVPPLFDYEPWQGRRQRDPHAGLALGFLSNFEWWPNRVGLDWFAREVLPRLEGRVRLHLFGQESHAAARGRDGVIAHGFVHRLDEVWETCDLAICPIANGAGVKVKLAEAVYNGVPVIARPFSTRGLPLGDDNGIVVLESADEWVDFLCSERAERLAGTRLAPSLGEAFSPRTHERAVHAFVTRVAGGRAA